MTAWDKMVAGWRGPVLAALVALLGALPGVLALPTLDRDEARFAQATAQMLETGDFVDIRFQEEPRYKKPVGIHWMQALSVSALSSVEAREIWAYRIPSLLGAMLAAAACAWGAAAFWSARTAFLAGAILGASLLLSTEATIAKTDAVLCGVVTLAMAALGRLYGQARGGPPAGRAARALFWIGVAIAVLVKGPVGPLVVAMTLVVLWAWDRRVRWTADLGWVWGLVLVAAVVGPWAIAVTVVSDGAFWGTAVGGDLAPKLVGGHETHGGPPGYHALLLPLLLFPATVLVPAAAVAAWRRRAEPGVRFAIAWAVPTFLLFEILPTKLPHYPLPAYGAVAWLAAASLTQPLGQRVRWIGGGLALLAGGLLAVAAVWVQAAYGGPEDVGWTVAAALLLGGAAVAAAGAMTQRASGPLLAAALAMGLAGHAAIVGGLAPALDRLWVTRELQERMAGAGLTPEGDRPAELAGYAEPSAVFELGTRTGLGDGHDAAVALAQGRPAVVEAKEEAGFRAELAKRGIDAAPAGRVEGFDYADGEESRLTLYRPAKTAEAP